MSRLLFDILPKLAGNCLFYDRWDAGSKERLQAAIFLADDQKALREELVKRKLAAFVADGAILPRESGISDLPMKKAVAFHSPGNAADRNPSAAQRSDYRHGDSGGNHCHRGRRLSRKIPPC